MQDAAKEPVASALMQSLYTYIYIYIYTYSMYVYIYIYIYTYIHTYVYIHMYIYIYTHMIVPIPEMFQFCSLQARIFIPKFPCGLALDFEQTFLNI